MATPYDFCCELVNDISLKHKNNCTIDLDDVIAAYKGNGGRCILTGAPFVFTKGAPTSPAIVTIDKTKGFHKGNIQLVALALDTPDRPSNEEFYEMRENFFQSMGMPIPPRTHSFN